MDEAIAPGVSAVETRNGSRRRRIPGAIPYVLLRIAGVYTSAVQPPTLAHQIRRIYERKLEARLFPGETSRGQSFIHIKRRGAAAVRAARVLGAAHRQEAPWVPGLNTTRSTQ